MSQNFEKRLMPLQNGESQIQQYGHNSTPDKAFPRRARPFTKVRFIYLDDEPGQFQVPFTLLTDVQPGKPIDQYHSAPGISPHNEASQLQVPTIPSSNPLTVPISAAPVTLLPEVYYSMTASSNEAPQLQVPTIPSSNPLTVPISAAPVTSLPEVSSSMTDSSIASIQNISIKRAFVSFFLQLLRFCIVGGINTFIDILIFNLLVWRFPTHDSMLLVFYNSLAYTIGAINSFCWNKLWTFKHHSRVTANQLVRFALVTSLGIICNDAFLWLATTILTSLSLNSFLWTNVAKIIAIAGSVAVSYLGMRFSVFTKKDKETIAPPPSNPRLSTVPHSLSVILPAYDEEALIADTVSTIVSVLSAWMPDFEVLVVNDGSKDRTGEIVADLAASDQHIRLINHPVNKGYGAALVTGFESVTKELAFFMDSDGQFDIRDLASFFPLIEEYGAVLGYRIDRQDTWMRKLNAWGWKQLVRLIFGVRVRDIDCAFKLFRAEFFRTYRLETRGAMINAEILYKLSRAGYTYTEVGVQHLPRRAGKATGAKPSVILRALCEMFIFAEKWRQEKQFSLL